MQIIFVVSDDIETLVSSFARPFDDIYAFFDQYLVRNILKFARGFELAIVLMAAMIFLLITVGITIREVKRHTFKVVGSAERVHFSPKVNHRI